MRHTHVSVYFFVGLLVGLGLSKYPKRARSYTSMLLFIISPYFHLATAGKIEILFSLMIHNIAKNNN